MASHPGARRGPDGALHRAGICPAASAGPHLARLDAGGAGPGRRGHRAAPPERGRVWRHRRRSGTVFVSGAAGRSLRRARRGRRRTHRDRRGAHRGARPPHLLQRGGAVPVEGRAAAEARRARAGGARRGGSVFCPRPRHGPPTAGEDPRASGGHEPGPTVAAPGQVRRSP